MATVTHRLVGREAELAALVGLLAAPDRLPATAVLSGDAGIGKTELWRAALEEAASRGYLLLTSRPTETEARFSFSGLADLAAGGLEAVLPELPEPQRQALETALALSDTGSPVEEGVVAFAFLNALRRLAGRSRVVLAVDDVQWLDGPSLALLRYALARLEAEPVAALLTVRGPTPAWLPQAVTSGRLTEIELRPLSLGALHELLRKRLGAGFPRPVLRRLWEGSGGNPFFALELARALERRGGIEPGAELPVPATLAELVHERLETLAPAAARVCAVVAASPEPTLPLVAGAVEGAQAGLEEALRARVLELDGERIRFTHPLLAAAVAARTVGERRRVLHERLAALASNAEERARHLALGAAGPSARVAAALDDAAARALRRGAPAAAAELADHALRLTPPGKDAARRRRRLKVAELHFHAGDVRRALAELEGAAADVPRGSPLAAVLLRLGRVRAETDGAAAAVAVFREALAEAAGDAELEARILLELGQFLRFSEGAEPALRTLEAAVEAAERVGDDELSCRVLAAHSLIHFNSGRGVHHAGLDRALELEGSLAAQGTPMVATPFLVHHLVWSGEVERARAVLAEWLAWAEARESPEAGDANWYRALLEWGAGEWDAAAEAATASVALMEQFGREAATITSWPLAVVAAHRGELDVARTIAERGLGTRGLPPVAAAGFEWVLGFGHLSQGDARGGLSHLLRAEEVYATLGILEPVLHWYLPDLLDALLRTGDAARAEETVAPWETRSRTLDRPGVLAVAARTHGLASAARGDVDGALASFEDALAQHGRTRAPFQHARTLLALGSTQRRGKRRAAARATLEQALALFEQLGAPLWAGQARAELARISGRAPSHGGLTESERRIAELVADGRSNREVAAALFLTEHTVETALSRIYRKLGVRSRTELAGRLAGEIQEAPAPKS